MNAHFVYTYFVQFNKQKHPATGTTQANLITTSSYAPLPLSGQSSLTEMVIGD